MKETKKYAFKDLYVKWEKEILLNDHLKDSGYNNILGYGLLKNSIEEDYIIENSSGKTRNINLSQNRIDRLFIILSSIMGDGIFSYTRNFRYYGEAEYSTVNKSLHLKIEDDKIISGNIKIMNKNIIFRLNINSLCYFLINLDFYSDIIPENEYILVETIEENNKEENDTYEYQGIIGDILSISIPNEDIKLEVSIIGKSNCKVLVSLGCMTINNKFIGMYMRSYDSDELDLIDFNINDSEYSYSISINIDDVKIGNPYTLKIKKNNP